ncbi:ARM REPEAT PROTEIN INTERACTING WITH ABF2, partial [Tetrabaena socialis]
LFADPASPDGQPAAPRRPYITSRGVDSGAWDPHSSAVYFILGGAILRLSGDNTVTVVAGAVNDLVYVDGPAGVARFDSATHLASDGAGALYVADGYRIRKLQLPPAEAGAGQDEVMLAAAGPGPGLAAAAAAAVAGGAPPGGGGAAADEVVVSTLPLQLPDEADVRCLAFDSGSTEGGRGGSLLYATMHALYRLPLGATAAAAAPVLLAGAEGVPGAVDGPGPDARFVEITGLAMDGKGAVWVTDNHGHSESAVRRVAADGMVTTIVANLERRCYTPAILPSGCLALCASGALPVLDLGLRPPSCIAGAPPHLDGGPPRTLPADLGALLDRQPDGTADVTIVVSGRTFHAHRLIVSARSDYFRQRLGGGFADGSAQQLDLPDADPDVFSLLLLFLYTGVADIPPAQAQALAELADRLLLPELCRLAQAVVVARVSAGTVVGLLLWAEARGPAFSELLSRLKAWYVEHLEAVLEGAPDAVEQLAAASLKLVSELTRDYTLVACGRELRPLTGAGSHGCLELGRPLQLLAHPACRDGQPAPSRRPYVPHCELTSPVWDPHSSAVYLIEGHAVLRLGSGNTVTVVAGDIRTAGNYDGPGGAARFTAPWSLASDGTGALYVADRFCIRKLQLPPAEGAPAWAPPAAAPAAAGGACTGDDGVAAGQAVVSTLPLQLPPGAVIGGLASDGGGSLLYSTNNALYRLPLGAATAVGPVLLAGAEGVRGTRDGPGRDARFFLIMGLAVDGEGAVWVAEVLNDSCTATSVRRVAADGTVTTAVVVEGICRNPALLPNGCLAMFAPSTLRVLDLGLKPPPSCSTAARQTSPAGPPPRTLPADLGALLDRQPDGTADVAIVVGGRTFHVHRAVLSARSDYFRQRLGGGFADSSAQHLDLPDADPDAFALLLLFLYTGAADIPPAQAQAVAALADRLLLPELCRVAADVVVGGVSAGTVVGLLLWAEARGPAFCELLSRLKAWYVDNHQAVLRDARDALKRLAVGHPDLMQQLLEGLRSAKRARNL